MGHYWPMINGLKIVNLPSKFDAAVPQELCEHSFVLKTCQRQLFVGFHNLPFAKTLDSLSEHIEFYQDFEAYLFLLETICGLKSQLMGENEIVSQFKSAYSDYLLRENKNSYVMEILEKLFKDAKKIRTEYLKEIGQYSYSGLSKRILKESGAQKGEEITIVGSGQLCHDLIKVLRKNYQLTLCARNRSKVEHLAQTYQLQSLSWDQRDSLAYDPFVINTIGIENTILFNQSFFNKWTQLNRRRLFIDLGSPSVLELNSHTPEGLYLLDDIFKAQGKLKETKRQKIEQARQAINQLSLKRVNSASVGFPYGWEDLQFV